MQKSIDLRSDTMTVATAAMRHAMAEAEVGDDVWNEDPTVLRLQREVAERLGKAAALFVPSGTMANQIALLVHTKRGEQVIGGWGSHVNRYEGGAAAALAGVQFSELQGDGFFTADDFTEALNPDDIHFHPCSLVWLESTHNKAGGRAFPIEAVDAIGERARDHGMRCHLDGARLYNAAIATGRPIARLVEAVDSCSLCLSKGLGAPVGSVLAGSTLFIEEARRWRKRLGGGMRQAGHLAAAGLFALEHNVDRLNLDHEHARVLAQKLATLGAVDVDLARVQTNMVLFDHPEPRALAARCQEHGVLLTPFGPTTLRAMTHLQITRDMCLSAAETISQVA